MNRLLGGAIGLAVAAYVAHDASAAQTRCEAFGKIESRQTRAGVFNPDDLLNLTTKLSEIGGLCDGALLGWSWQARATAERDAGGADTSNADVALRQFYRTFDLVSPWSLTVGKKLRGWDVGYIAQPIDFLGESKNVRDLEDRLSERKASTFVAFDRIGDSWTTSVIVGENRLYPDVRTQAIVSAEKNFQGTNMQLIAQKPADQPWGAGAGVSTVIGTALELHGSFFTRRGTERPIHLSLINDDFRFYQANDNPVANHRLHDDRWYPRWVLGGQWTAEFGLNVLLEWSHDERGLTPAQWRELIALTRFHAAGGNFGVPPAAIAGNIALDASTLSRTGANMQDYAFLRLAYPFAWLDVEVSSLLNTHDRSSSAGTRFTYKPSQRGQLWLDLRWNRGRRETEFAEVPLARDALLGLRYFF